jgi:hypothetical protein
VSRDPIDARLVVLVDQADHVVVQLTEMTTAHAPLSRVGFDPMGFAAALRASAEAGALAWTTSVRARLRLKARSRTSAQVAAEGYAWTLRVRDALRVAGPAPVGVVDAVAALRAATSVSRPRLAGVARALDAAVISAELMAWHPPLVELGVAGVGLRERADRAVRRMGESEAFSAASAAGADQHRDLLRGQLRLVRRAWRAAARIDPELPALNLTVLSQELAMVLRREAAGVGPVEPVEPVQDAVDDPVQDLVEVPVNEPPVDLAAAAGSPDA